MDHFISPLLPVYDNEMSVQGSNQFLSPVLPIDTINIPKEGGNMLSIAVCDDNIRECAHIAAKIKGILRELKVPFLLCQFHSGKELLKAPEAFDILFLDIIMDGLDGMKTAELFRKTAADKLLIFISSSRKYVFEAYDVEAFWYLVKPIDDKKLKKALQRAVQKLEKSPKSFLIVNKDRQKKKLFLDNIYYFEIKGRMIYVHGTDGIFTYYEQIGRLEERLIGEGFFRCHKSYLINLKYVDTYNRQEAVLDNGEKIMIAKRRYEEFGKEILAYMRTNGGIL